MGLHIGIDGSCITSQKAGIGFYTARLLRALGEIPGNERYTIFSNKEFPGLKLPDRFEIDITPLRSTTLWAQSMLWSRLHKKPVDVFHSGSIGIPLFYRGKTVITVHDLSYLQFPKQKDRMTRILWGTIGPRLIRKASHILTDTEFIKKDVANYFGISESKITSTHLAADPLFSPIEDSGQINGFRRSKGLERGYILFVGTLEPRKNIPFLLRCFANCVKQGNIDGDLVIIGKKGWFYNDIFEIERELNLRDRIRFLGYLEDSEELRRYYCGCRFFVFPSLFEGFGLPPLEAMSCDAPVITSTRGSLPEVVNGAGLLLDPDDAPAWESAMTQWWNAPDLSEWKKKAKQRAMEFSWQKTAEQTLEVYRNLMQA